jgi:hypothetical protein
MEPFFCRRGGKKLPGKHGQQDLSAARKGPGKSPKSLQNKYFPGWHGIRSTE